MSLFRLFRLRKSESEEKKNAIYNSKQSEKSWQVLFLSAAVYCLTALKL